MSGGSAGRLQDRRRRGVAGAARGGEPRPATPGRRGPRLTDAGSGRREFGGGEPTDRARWPCAGLAARPPSRGVEPPLAATWGGVSRTVAGSVGAWLAAGAIVGGGRGPPRPVEPSACSAPPPWGCGAFWRVRGAGRVGGGAAGGTQGRRQAGGRKMFSRPPRIEKGRARIDFRG